MIPNLTMPDESEDQTESNLNNEEEEKEPFNRSGEIGL